MEIIIILAYKNNEKERKRKTYIQEKALKLCSGQSKICSIYRRNVRTTLRGYSCDGDSQISRSYEKPKKSME